VKIVTLCPPIFHQLLELLMPRLITLAAEHPRRRLGDGPVVAVLRDRPSDVTVAHHAARRAQRESRGLVLVVPLPVGRRAARRDAAAAIAGRVQPELAKIGEVASVHLATYVDSPDRRRRERRILAAVNRTTARLRAAVVLSAADSLTRLPARIDYEPADQMPAAGRETERVSPLPSHR
jgi:hypothetical protein